MLYRDKTVPQNALRSVCAASPKGWDEGPCPAAELRVVTCQGGLVRQPLTCSVCDCVQLMVAPLRRLGVNRPTPIDKVGSPESVLSSIGPFITGMIPPPYHALLLPLFCGEPSHIAAHLWMQCESGFIPSAAPTLNCLQALA